MLDLAIRLHPGAPVEELVILIDDDRWAWSRAGERWLWPWSWAPEA